MSFFSDTRETSARYGAHIAEFQELCKQHEVSSGTPEDFFRLAPKLAYDEKFRGDFCRLTKSVAQRENGRLTLTRILTIIALAMGGEGIDAIGTAGAVPVSLVVVFLAGVGDWSEKEGEDIAQSSSPLTDQIVPEQKVLSDNEEAEGLELERRLASEPHDLTEMTASLFGGPALVKEALCRLELNTLELKLHLDSIDSRMERIEPHLDDLTLRLAKDAPLKMETLGKAETSQKKISLPTTRFSKPELRIDNAENETKIVPPVEVIATTNPAEVKNLHRLVTTLALLLIAMTGVIGTLLYLNHGTRVNAGIGDILSETVGNASAKTISTSSSSTPSAIATPPPTPPAETKAAEVETPGAGKPQVKAPAEAKTPMELPKRIPAITEQAARKINPGRSREDEAPNAPLIRLADALPGAVAAKTENVSSMAAVRTEPAPSNVPTESAPMVPTTSNRGSVAGDSRIKIFVPANTLVKNAIASPPPLYPSLARIQRVEGDVLLQAFVDEAGKVENVSVVNGPEPLRNAAMDALRNWRFRPYTIDGHPVAVRTLVDFHFKMAQ